MSEQDATPAKRPRMDAEDTESDEVVGPPVLPAEMFELVIACMNVNELLVCRSVCKYFKQVVDRIKFRSMVIAESEESTCYPVLEYWKEDYGYNKETLNYKRFDDQFFFVTNEPVYESDTLFSSDTSAGLRVLMIRFDLSALRKLFIVEARQNGQSLFGLINGLPQLQHLQIDLIDLVCNLRLQLPNLRVLSVAKVRRQGEFAIWLDTPSLTHLETSSLRGSKFQFEHRESITFLQCSNFSHVDLFELENLKTLICEYADNLVNFEEDSDAPVVLNFADFPRLRRVDCARMLIKEAQELFFLCGGNGIDFYYCGRRVDDLDLELGELFESSEEDSFIQLLTMDRMLSVYDRLADSLYFVEGIRYFKHLDTYFPKKLPENFARKFYCVREVYVARKIENVDYFLEFLRCFRNLKVLWLHYAALSQDFFDRHSHLFARLHEFSYKDRSDRSPNEPSEIDFKFILNLRFLKKFFTNQRISLRLLSDAFNTLKYLESFWVEDFLDFKITREEDRLKVLCIDFEQNFPTHQFTSKTEMLKFMEKQFPALSATSSLWFYSSFIVLFESKLVRISFTNWFSLCNLIVRADC